MTSSPTSEPVAIVLGTFDTKAAALADLIKSLHGEGVTALTIDVGTNEPDIRVDITRREVIDAAQHAGHRLQSTDRRTSLAFMAAGAEQITQRLVREGRAHGIIAAGGAGNAELAGSVMQTLPLGFPKVLVTTLASGNTQPLIGGADITLINPVADVARPNPILRRALATAAAALAGTMRRSAATEPRPDVLVYASMFGITTPCVEAASNLLEQSGAEVVAFHATGVGGRTLERFIGEMPPDAVLDITTTEWADEVVGGICAAGPYRLEAAGALGIPQVVVPGALDAVNFGAPDSVPGHYLARNLHRHAAAVTLMRTDAAESITIADRITERLNAATGPVTVALPTGGISALDRPGEPFWDPVTDRVLFDRIKARLRPDIPVIESPHHINDPAFADILVEQLTNVLTRKGTPRHVR